MASSSSGIGQGVLNLCKIGANLDARLGLKIFSAPFDVDEPTLLETLLNTLSEEPLLSPGGHQNHAAGCI
jgi:hypothetical protein